VDQLEAISSLSAEEAKSQLIESLKDDARHEAMSKINEIIEEATKIYSGGKEPTPEIRAKVAKMFKNRFYHYPEGETLIEADWRIAHSFVDLLNRNLGKRILIANHSGAIRVFEAIIRTLDFAEYSSIKESQDSILALCYLPGRNLRYDYLQKKEYPLRERNL